MGSVRRFRSWTGVSVVVLLIAVSIVLGGCEDLFEYEDSSGADDDTSSDGTIQEDSDAEDLAKDLHRVVRDVVADLSEGSYSGEVISGANGTATVTGTKTIDKEYWSDSTSTTNDYEFDIVCSDFMYLSYSGATVSGTVDYKYYSHSTTYGYGGYSSSYNIKISGSSVVVDSGLLADTIDITVWDDDSNSLFEGTVEAGGKSYTVDYYLP